MLNPLRRAAARVPGALPPLWADGRRRSWLAVAALALAQALLAGLLALGVRSAFTALHAGGALPWNALGLIAGAGLGIALARWAERLCAETLSQRYVLALRQRLLAHIARLPHETLTWLRRGHLQQRLAGDMGSVRAWVGRGQAHLLSATVTLPTVCTLLALWMAPLLVAGVGLSLLGGLLLMALLARGLPQGQARLRRAQGRLHAHLGERLPHAQALRLAGRLGRETRTLTRLGERLHSAALGHQRRAAALRATPDLVRGLAVAWVLGAAFHARLPPADAAATLAAVGLLMPALRDLAGAWEHHTAWCRTRTRLLALLARPTLGAVQRRATKNEAGDAQTLLLWQGPGPQPWQLGLPRHSHTALGGAPGTGKSRLLRALAGLDSAGQGRVLRGPAAPQRLRVCRVHPRAPLLAGSLRRALTLDCRHRPDDAHITAVATAFGLQGLLARPGGLSSRVAEDGANLSDTDVRRLLLARAALSDADLVLLDDLDLLLDAGIRAAWQDWLCSTDRTVLFVSQAPALQALADAVWQLDGARPRPVATQGHV